MYTNPAFKQRMQGGGCEGDIPQNNHLIDLRKWNTYDSPLLPGLAIGRVLDAERLAFELHHTVLFGQIECRHKCLNAFCVDDLLFLIHTSFLFFTRHKPQLSDPFGLFWQAERLQ